MPHRATTSLVVELAAQFMSRKDPAQAEHLMRFFRTGLGQYGEGDRFLGIKVPATRAIISGFRRKLSLDDYDALLASEWHEVRLGALLLMGDYARALGKQGRISDLRELVQFYDSRLDRANNWDLVDMSVRDIMGAYWAHVQTGTRERRRLLKTWAGSGKLWRERSAMIATYALQRLGSLDETFWLAEFFIDHPHDLMHKACGWMLREAGKIDLEALRGFLAVFHRRLPRTALRYAIERMDADERGRWMAK